MIVLSSLEHRIDFSLRTGRLYRLQDFFRLYNEKGLITYAATVWIAMAVAAYLMAAYSLFGWGVILQRRSATIKDLTESNVIIDLNLQQRQTEFARNNRDMLQSMEKISDMRYVLPTDTAVSRADVTPDRDGQ